MLTGEPNLPESIFAPDGNVVNRLFDVLLRDADLALAMMFADTLKRIQNTWFAAGHRGCCPRCLCDLLIRKGWRRRVVKTSRGTLAVAVLQAKCKECGRVFRPMNELIGLPFAKRVLDEFIEKAIHLGIKLSFAKSADLLKQLTSASLSAEGIRNKIAQAAASIEFASEVDQATVLIDSTKVKAGKKDRGIPVHLAITAAQGPQEAGRSTIRKRLLHLSVGAEHPLRTRLKALRPAYLVYDGGPYVDDIPAFKQRCRWHLVHQLKHYLWQDGVPFDLRGRCQEVLRHILWDKKGGRKRFDHFINDLTTLGLEKSATHLSQAGDEAFTHYKQPGFSYSTTTPLEREMRELNRRADVGARWSAQGIENVLKVLFHLRLNESTA